MADTEEKQAAPKGKKGKKDEEPEKPFPQTIEEDLIPATQTAFQKRKVNDLELTLDGKTLIGRFGEGRRQFRILFADEDLKGKKFFSCSSDGATPSTVESFMIDERKQDLDLVVFYITQRLYAQQWL